MMLMPGMRGELARLSIESEDMRADVECVAYDWFESCDDRECCE
jgi:hypothetical protein